LQRFALAHRGMGFAVTRGHGTHASRERNSVRYGSLDDLFISWQANE
jgi:hypothetical protein